MNMGKMGLLVVLVALAGRAAVAKDVVAANVVTAGSGVNAALINDAFQAELSTSETIVLVDRGQLREVMSEHKLGQQAVVSPEAARQMGRVLGARYFCGATITLSGSNVMSTIRVIDVETTLVKVDLGKLEMPDDPLAVGKVLARQVEKVVGLFDAERAMIAKGAAAEAKDAVKAIPEEWKRPTVMVIIREMHVRRPVLIDPAGETEIVKRLLADGFRVVDSEYVGLMKEDQARADRMFGKPQTAARFAAEKKVDVLLYGEAISERAADIGDFTGCRARVELKAIRTSSDEILLSDSATGGATDLAETVAGKKAIQDAANRLADKFLYSLAQKWNGRPAKGR